ncbi:glycosyl transferase family 90-domain-containing protein [Mycena filopes]|nr:glycosyl transferase family 90-domain-containing protein [Mycena filopes]
MAEHVDDAPLLADVQHLRQTPAQKHPLALLGNRFLARRRNTVFLFVSVSVIIFIYAGFVLHDQQLEIQKYPDVQNHTQQLEIHEYTQDAQPLDIQNSSEHVHQSDVETYTQHDQTETHNYTQDAQVETSSHPQDPETQSELQLARADVDHLLARQSKTLQQATARYMLKNDRPPPPGYDKFFEFATQQACLIDDYDKIYRDFEPFYQLAKYHPTFFSDMLERGMQLAANDSALCLSPLKVKDHQGISSPHGAPYAGDWETILEILGPMLPDMDLLFNFQDEPRVLFNTRRPDAYEFALKKADVDPFRQGPRPTKEYYEEVTPHQCLLPNSATGFGNITNDASAFMVSSVSTQHTHDLYPVLSPGRITSCFADIVVPSAYYYDRSGFAARMGFPDNVAWADKKAVIYWRGHTSGGAVDGQNYHAFPRFRIIDIARRRPDIIDAALTGLHNCNPDPNNDAHAVCPEEEIKQLYDVDTPPLPREEVYKYKYALDLDGNGFSGRFMGLLRSGSLVFKSTIISDFFDDWLLPYVHYVPVLPDLSDLERKVEWAIANDAEARQIQANGLEFATRVITDGQMDCYHLLVFLEHARLQTRA